MQVDIYMRDSSLGTRYTLQLTMGVDGIGEVAEKSKNSSPKKRDKIVLYPYEFSGQCSYCLSV
ncbi:MAG: hypothetical protein DHS20C07_31530 [Methyloligella sp.]|nr:MAG: hypothetical protein DHS20C07_31530 [Methyloligella sp.]